MKEPNMIARFLPLAGMILFFVIGFWWREWLHRRKFGQSGIMLFRSGVPGQLWRDSLALSLFLLSLAQGLLAAFWRGAWHKWSVLPQPADVIWQAFGGIVLFGGITLLALAQRDLGKSWRIGIEENARPGLVCEGLFRWCRNPIFFAVLTIVGGYAILLPTWLSLALWVATFFLVERQVREEEAYLARAYPENFPAYARNIGRFLPGIGCLK